MEDGARDGQPLDEPLREVADGLVGPVGDVELLEDRLDPGVSDPVEIGVVAEVLAAAQLPLEERLMADVADPGRQLPALVR